MYTEGFSRWSEKNHSGCQLLTSSAQQEPLNVQQVSKHTVFAHAKSKI